MDVNYPYKLYYYPYIGDNIGNHNHLAILNWLRENFNPLSWNISWEIDGRECANYDVRPDRLWIYFRKKEDMVAFKLRWCED